MADEVYTYTGAEQTTTVPSNTNEAIIEAWGAQGEDGEEYNGSSSPGGQGGRVKGTISVSPGQTLYIYVGNRSGWNGGASMEDAWVVDAAGGNGGGATDLRRGGNTLSDRLFVAGGGGGGGGGKGGAPGGEGGGLSGGNGGENGDADSDYGRGGDQSSGGAGGSTADETAEDGSLGQGGASRHYNQGYSVKYGGGAGAGGYYGGGGAVSSQQDIAGGGGGSGFATGGASNVSHSTGVRSGDGRLEITWVQPPDAPTNVSVEEVSGDAYLTWTDGNGTNTVEIHRSTEAGVDTSATPLDTVAAGVEEYTDTTVDEGIEYHYRLVATNADGSSPNSSEVSLTMTLPAPTIDTVTET